MKKLELIGKTQMPTLSDRADAGLGIEDFCTEEADRNNEFWNSLFTEFSYFDYVEDESSTSNAELCERRKTIKRDVLKFLEDGANVFSKGE